jgi:hypothetical protein
MHAIAGIIVLAAPTLWSALGYFVRAERGGQRRSATRALRQRRLARRVSNTLHHAAIGCGLTMAPETSQSVDSRGHGGPHPVLFYVGLWAASACSPLRVFSSHSVHGHTLSLSALST